MSNNTKSTNRRSGFRAFAAVVCAGALVALGSVGTAATAVAAETCSTAPTLRSLSVPTYDAYGIVRGFKSEGNRAIYWDHDQSARAISGGTMVLHNGGSSPIPAGVTYVFSVDSSLGANIQSIRVGSAPASPAPGTQFSVSGNTYTVTASSPYAVTFVSNDSIPAGVPYTTSAKITIPYEIVMKDTKVASTGSVRASFTLPAACAPNTATHENSYPIGLVGKRP